MTIPSNKCSFKLDRGKKPIQIFNSCTIDYFLFSLWITFRFDKAYENEIKKRASNESLYDDLFEIINLVERRNWAKAKYHWLTEVLKKKVIDGSIDCEGSLYESFIQIMYSLQKHYYLVKTCTDLPELNFKKEKKEFFKSFNADYLINLVNERAKCKNLCGSCKWKQAFFEFEPIWLLVDYNERETIDITKIPINLDFGAGNEYNLLCLYAFFKNPIGLSHFKGIYFLNSKFYVVDDLIKQGYEEIKENVKYNISCLIYYKKIEA